MGRRPASFPWSPAVTENDLFVIVPYRNDERHLLDTLFALAEQTDRRYTLVLVDRGSTDGSARIVSRFTRGMRWPRVETLEADGDVEQAAHAGFAQAVARGARWVAWIEPDCKPEPSWVENVRRSLGQGSELVLGKVERAQPAGALARMRGWVAACFGRRESRASNVALSVDLYRRLPPSPGWIERARHFASAVDLRDDVVVVELSPLLQPAAA